jgi:hypothetical protein
VSDSPPLGGEQHSSGDIASAESVAVTPDIPEDADLGAAQDAASALGDKPALAGAAQEILAAAEAERAALTQSEAAERAAVLAHGEQRATAMETSADHHAEGLQTAITEHEKQTDARLTAATTEVDTTAAAHRDAAVASQTHASAAIEQHRDIHGANVVQAGTRESQVATQSGEAQSQRASASKDDAVSAITNAARNPTSPSITGAALGWLRDKLQSGIAPGLRAITQHGADLTRGAISAAGRLASSLAQAATKTADALTRGASQTLGKVREVGSGLITQLSTIATRVTQALSGARTSAAATMDQARTDVNGVRTAGRDAAARTRKAARASAARIAQTAAQGRSAQGRLAAQMVGLLHQHGNPRDGAALGDAARAATDGLRDHRATITAGLTQQSTGTRARIDSALPALSDHLGAGRDRLTGRLAASTAQLDNAVSTATAGTRAELTDSTAAGQQAQQAAAQRFGDDAAQQSARATQQLAGQRASGTADITAKVDAGVSEHSAAENKATAEINAYTSSVNNKALEDKGWWEGIKEGAGKFFKGLMEFVFVVVIVAVGVVEFGLGLAWGAVTLAIAGEALLIALAFVGTLLLIAGLVMTFVHRWEQYKSRPGYANEKWWETALAVVGVAVITVFDVFGVGPLLEAFLGVDLVTGKHLTDQERGERLAMGALTLVSLWLMRRVAKAYGKGQTPVEDPALKGAGDPNAEPPVPDPAVKPAEPPRPLRSDGQPVSDAAIDVLSKATPERQAAFRRNPDFLERFAALSADDQAFLAGISDPAFDAYASLPPAQQGRFLAVSRYTYTTDAGQVVSYRANYAALSPARQVALLSEAEIVAAEKVAAMDTTYQNERGMSQKAHSFAEHGSFRSDAEMFARAKAARRPVSRYNSSAAQEAQAARFRQILEDPATPEGEDSPIYATPGHKAIKRGTTTAEKILSDPANNLRYLKSKVIYKQKPAGPDIGTEFDPDGITTRPVEHVTVVFELDSGGKYHVLTNFPERL